MTERRIKINTSITTDLIRRAANGEKLSAEEKAALNKFEMPAFEAVTTDELSAEINMLKDALKRAKNECEEAQGKLKKLHFDHHVMDLARKHNFTDSEYLGFLLEKNQLSLDDDDVVDEFISTLKEQKGSLFKVTGKNELPVTPLTGEFDTGMEIFSSRRSGRDSLTELLALAPEAR